MSMIEPTLTDAEVNALPLDERIQIALHEAFGNEDEAATAYEAIEPLLATVYRTGHYCGVTCEKDNATTCQRNPFGNGRSW